MTASRRRRWAAPGRRGTAAIVAVVLAVVVGATVGLVLTVTSAGAGAGAARGVSYCSASRTVDSYHGRDRPRLLALLEPVRRHAPAEIASTVAALQAAPPASAAFRTARGAWDRYNTNHCCTCIGGPGVPLLASTPPSTRSP